MNENGDSSSSEYCHMNFVVPTSALALKNLEITHLSYRQLTAVGFTLKKNATSAVNCRKTRNFGS